MGSEKFSQENQSQIVETTLDLLSALEEEPPTSQRNLSSRLGVALGLTNSLLKRCVRKGILKVRHTPAKRYAYYLTPRGFREKSVLTARYISNSLHFFRHARAQYREAFDYCYAREWRRIAFYGASELAEIAAISGKEADVELVVVIDPGRNVQTFCDLPVSNSISDAPEFDAVILTCAENPQEGYDSLAGQFPVERIVTPAFLRVTRGANPNTSEGE